MTLIQMHVGGCMEHPARLWCTPIFKVAHDSSSVAPLIKPMEVGENSPGYGGQQ